LVAAWEFPGTATQVVHFEHEVLDDGVVVILEEVVDAGVVVCMVVVGDFVVAEPPHWHSPLVLHGHHDCEPLLHGAHCASVTAWKLPGIAEHVAHEAHELLPEGPDVGDGPEVGVLVGEPKFHCIHLL
jgi:hypothetical protein